MNISRIGTIVDIRRWAHISMSMKSTGLYEHSIGPFVSIDGHGFGIAPWHDALMSLVGGSSIDFTTRCCVVLVAVL